MEGKVDSPQKPISIEGNLQHNKEVEVVPMIPLIPPSIELVKKCLEKGAISQYTGPAAEERKDYYGDLVEIHVPKVVEIQKELEKKRESEIIDSPEGEERTEDEKYIDELYAEPHGDFDWNKDGRKAMRDAIAIVHKLSIVDRETLVNASKFAGPGNVKFVSEGDKGLLGTQRLVEYYKSEGHWDGKGNMPFPSKETRDSQVDFTIPNELVDGISTDFLLTARKLGMRLTAADSIRIAFMIVGAHEYGHAIENALDIQGKPPQEIVKKQPVTTWIDQLRQNEELKIHREHFAGGIENMVLRKALTDIFNFTPEQEGKFMSFIGTHYRHAEELIQLAKEKGFSFEDIMVIDKDLKEYGVFDESNSLEHDFAYTVRPYTEEQIRQLTQGSLGN